MYRINIRENKINFVAEITDDNDIRLLHLSSLPFDESNILTETYGSYRMLELQASGYNQSTHHGMKYLATSPANLLKYKTHLDYRNKFGRKLEFVLANENLEAVCHYQFYDNIKAIRAYTYVENKSSEQICLEYVSSFALTGIQKEGTNQWDKESLVHIAHNYWYGECQWRCSTCFEYGLSNIFSFSLKRIALSNNGTWSSQEHLPMGCYENTVSKNIILWQIENNGSWHWEISTVANGLYLQLSGPEFNDNHWQKILNKGESFLTVPVSLAFTNNGFENAFSELTKYRRAIRRPNIDNIQLPVIFNDFMNCLSGDGNMNNLPAFIEKAAYIGCEYFCIDCGWYSDIGWWNLVGEWLPSKIKYPNGIEEALNYIRKFNMIPGLWVEIEVMGIECPLANTLPDDWFFCRNGKKVIDHYRYQLDFRNENVVEYANKVFKRLVEEYGVGYIKIDYNINAGIGTDLRSDSLGDGLLEHNRAYIAWLKNILKKYPNLVIENCGSGGQRLDYALLEQCSMQSNSDQTDYKLNSVICAASATAVTPEQCAAWSYPLKSSDAEDTVFNMVNTMLLRILQSGRITEISDECLDLIKEGIDCYKNIRKDIPTSLPFWPLGLPTIYDDFIAYGLENENCKYVAVWKLDTDISEISIPLENITNAECIYPKQMKTEFEVCGSNLLNVVLSNKYTARLFRLR